MKNKIGIFIDTFKISGGAYQELSYFIRSLQKYNKHQDLEFVIIKTSGNIEVKKDWEKLRIYNYYMNAFSRYFHYLMNYNHFFRKLRQIFNFENKFEKFLNKNNIDHVIFTGPAQHSLYIETTSFSMIIPDVAHRENVEFPELCETSKFEWKDNILSKSLPRASLIITNSNIIKERISFFYRILKERILVVNQQTGDHINNFNIKLKKENIISYKKTHNLPEKYLFYPAMYLPHKNHKCIIDSIKILNEKFKQNFSAVFCGGDKGYLHNLKIYSKKLNVRDKIKFLEFVKDEDLPLLYCNSFSLVMPALIGPTNIPPWEAFRLETPVIYTNFKNIRETLEDAVIYIDPYDPNSLAESVIKLNNDKNLRENLISKGKNLVNKINYEADFNQVFRSLKHIRKIRERWIFN